MLGRLATVDTIVQQAVNLLQTYVVPQLWTLVIAFIIVWFAFALSGRRANSRMARSVEAEIASNARIAKDIVAYSEVQLGGEGSIAPMPMFEVHAFADYKRLPRYRRMSKDLRRELQDVYLNMTSVNKAGRRQEELAFGPAAAFPNAHTLRLENLTYVRDTVHNVIGPYLDRVKEIRF